MLREISSRADDFDGIVESALLSRLDVSSSEKEFSEAGAAPTINHANGLAVKFFNRCLEPRGYNIEYFLRIKVDTHGGAEFLVGQVGNYVCPMEVSL